MDIDIGFLRTAALGALAIVVFQGLPRVFKTIYNETANALLPSLSGTRRAIALLFGIASMFWFLMVVGLIYEPIVLFAPQFLPFSTGVLRALLVFEVGLLIFLPLLAGATEAFLTQGSIGLRVSMIPRAFVHIPAFGLALLTLIPWIIWRFVVVVGLARWKVEQFRIEIEPDKYDAVADELEGDLRRAGLTARSEPLPRLVRISRWFMYRFGPPMLRPKGEYHARRIRGTGYGVLVFDGMIEAISQRSLQRRLRAALIGGIPPDGLWLTQSEEARELERLIRMDGDLEDIPRRLSEIDAGLEDWRVLSWEYTLILAKRDDENR